MAEIKGTHAGAKMAGEQVPDLLKNTYAATSKGTADYNLKIVEIAGDNTKAAFEYLKELMGVKSAPEFVALSSAYARKQFDTMMAQIKELTELAQKVTMDFTQPLKGGVAMIRNTEQPARLDRESKGSSA